MLERTDARYTDMIYLIQVSLDVFKVARKPDATSIQQMMS